MIEAMACGTPVIAWPCGAVPEVIDDGITGFVVNDVDQAVAATEKIDHLDRNLVRRRFEARFTAALMTSHYLRVYALLVASQALTGRTMAFDQLWKPGGSDRLKA